MSGSKNRKEDDFSRISVHDNIIVIDSRVLQIKNISRITAYSVGFSKFIKVLISILFIISLIYVIDDASSRYGRVSQFSIVISLVLFFASLFVLFNVRHGVQIQTNGGTSDFLLTQEKEKAENLLAQIAFVMEGDLDLKGRTMTINNNLEIVEGDQILGDKFSKIRDSLVYKNEEHKT